MLAVPQIAALARLARRLGITISRAAVAADGEQDLDLWVRAEPEGDEVALAITGWTGRPARPPAPRRRAGARGRFPARRRRLDLGDRRHAAPDRAVARRRRRDRPQRRPTSIGKQLTRLFRFRESDDGALPILTALAEHKSFEGQVAELRGGRKGRYLLSGVPLIDGMGRFAGFRGAAAAAPSRRRPPARRPPAPRARAPRSASGSTRRCASPLAHIIDNAERLRAQPEGPLRRDYAGYAADIASAGRHLLALVDDLVDLQAIERPDFRPEAEAIDLADIARRAAGLLARARRRPRRPHRRRPAPTRPCPRPATSPARCRS